MAEYSIRDLEQLTGIKAHTIRIWEKRYNIIKPERTKTNIRYYTDQDLKRILNISILNKSGMKVSDIAKLDKEQSRDKIVHLSNNPKDRAFQIENLMLSMIDLDEQKFEKNLSRLILQNGFRKTVMEIIFPFLEKIGVLWQTGAINSGQEHFVSNIIRRKFIIAIDSQTVPEIPLNKNFLLFLPEGEFHELSLLFYSYVLRRTGYSVTYLGQSVPFQDLLEITKIKKIDYLFTSMVTSMLKKDFENFINKLSTTFHDKIIFLTGRQLKENMDFNIPVNIKVITSNQDLKIHLPFNEVPPGETNER
ncbi:MAG: MerR family transcriptional regulator [bacterium]